MTKTRERCVYPFKLRPFDFAGNSRGLTLGGTLQRLPGALCISYRLEGDLQAVVLPASNSLYSRRHELWRHTCFELFFGIPGNPQYWEVNLGPDGCWNLYHFVGYRLGMQEEAAVEVLTPRVIREGDSVSLVCQIDMRKLVPDRERLEVGVAGVVLDTSGTVVYWAIDHCEIVPDFHRRQSFLMALPGMAKM